MSWEKMCKCLCPCIKNTESTVTIAPIPHVILRVEMAAARQVAPQHRYTDTVVDIRGALSTPVIEYNPGFGMR